MIEKMEQICLAKADTAWNIRIWLQRHASKRQIVVDNFLQSRCCSIVHFGKAPPNSAVDKLTICESINFCLRYVSATDPSANLERYNAVRRALRYITKEINLDERNVHECSVRRPQADVSSHRE